MPNSNFTRAIWFNKYKNINHESLYHWREQLRESLTLGKTIIIYLNKYSAYEGFGRLVRSLDIIPVLEKILFKDESGLRMKLCSDNDLLMSYWKVFESKSKYEITFEYTEKPAITTIHGTKAVSLITKYNNSGTLILLPNIDFSEFSLFDDTCSDNTYTDYYEQSKELTKQFITEIVKIDKTINATNKLTAPPDWLTNDIYELKTELIFNNRLLELNSQLETLKKQVKEVENKLEKSAYIKHLLYETGKPLELSILEALKILGFNVSQYQDDESEFDIVAECL